MESVEISEEYPGKGRVRVQIEFVKPIDLLEVFYLAARAVAEEYVRTKRPVVAEGDRG